MTRLAVIIATIAGLGYVPFAPGTFGSAAGLALYWPVFGSAGAQLLAICTLLALGIWSATTAERFFATDDPGPVVIDEVMGMLITLFQVRVGWAGALVGFLLFRIADIVKPFPSGRLERLPGGLGVMADDAMAAVYANLALRGVLWAAPQWFT